MGQAAQKSSDGLKFHTDMPVGEILRRTRVHYKQSLPDVEKAIRIRACQLQAIEEGNLEALPGKVYAIGFVRSYSSYLGLNADQMVRLFKSQAEGRAIDPALNFPVAASETHIAPAWFAGGAAMLAVLVIGLFISFQTSKPANQPAPIPEVADVMPNVVASEAVVMGPQMPSAEDVAAVEPAAAPAPEKPAKAEGALLKITENSWVEITDAGGKVLLSRVLNKGDRYFIPNRPDLSMSLGNAGGVELVMDDKPLGAFGEKGVVKRDISLDLEALSAQFTPQDTQPEQ